MGCYPQAPGRVVGAGSRRICASPVPVGRRRRDYSSTSGSSSSLHDKAGLPQHYVSCIPYRRRPCTFPRFPRATGGLYRPQQLAPLCCFRCQLEVRLLHGVVSSGRTPDDTATGPRSECTLQSRPSSASSYFLLGRPPAGLARSCRPRAVSYRSLHLHLVHTGPSDCHLPKSPWTAAALVPIPRTCCPSLACCTVQSRRRSLRCL